MQQVIKHAASPQACAQPTTNKTWLRTSAVGGRVGVAAHGRLPPSLAVSDHLPFCRRFSCGPHQMVGEANVSCQQWVGGGAKVSCVQSCKHVLPAFLCVLQTCLAGTPDSCVLCCKYVLPAFCVECCKRVLLALVDKHVLLQTCHAACHNSLPVATPFIAYHLTTYCRRRGIMLVSCIHMFTPIYMPIYMPLIVSYTQADT